MARLDKDWRILELAGIKEPEKRPDTDSAKRELELVKKIDLKKIFKTSGNRVNKNGFNA